MATTITAGNSTNGAAIASDNTGILELKSGTGSGTTAVTIGTTQNVGIGTSSPGTKLQVAGTSGSAQFQAGTAANGYLQINAFDSSAVYCVVGGANATQAVFGSQSNIPTVFFTNNAERARITSDGLFQFNSGYGSVATAFGCRAWVNFNGTGTVAIRASGNVSSITDNNTGIYTVNFTNAMPDADYAVVCTSTGFNNGSTQCITNTSGADGTANITTSAVTVNTRGNGATASGDCLHVHVSIFR